MVPNLATHHIIFIYFRPSFFAEISGKILKPTTSVSFLLFAMKQTLKVILFSTALIKQKPQKNASCRIKMLYINCINGHYICYM